MAAGERPWLSPGPPPWATPAPRPRWWPGLTARLALVCVLFVPIPRKDPTRDL